VLIVERGPVFFVAQLDKQPADCEVAQGGGEVEAGVGEPFYSVVRVVNEVGVGFEDSLDEEGIVGADCSSESDGGVDPASSSDQMSVCHACTYIEGLDCLCVH